MRYTNNFHLPKEIVNAIVNDDYDFPSDEKTIPCSKLITPTRINILTKRHDSEIVKDISDEVWALFGTSVHYILSKQSGDDVVTEKRVSVPFMGYTITGKPDCFYPETGEIKDYKVTSSWKIVFGADEGYKEWEEQLNVYAWLLRKSGSTVAKLTITAILRDWSQREAMNNSSYPNIQVKEIDLPLWSEEEQEKFIASRITYLLENDGLEDDCIVLCTPSERWASPTTYRIEKKDRKTAVRVFKTKEETIAWLDTNGTKEMYITEKAGEDKRCSRYCEVSKWCEYHKGKEAP